jgi:hypothetical protein
MRAESGCKASWIPALSYIRFWFTTWVNEKIKNELITKNHWFATMIPSYLLGGDAVAEL